MNTRRLGRTGYMVSDIGFGAWGLGGAMWRGVPDEVGKRAVQEALDRGVSFFDTALAYGDGHSEKLLAEVLGGGRGGDVVIATKIPPKNRIWPGHATSALRDVFPAAWIETCVEQSLRNLRVDSLDLEQLHVWHDAWLEAPEWEKTRRALERLQEAGKVRHWGISINAHAPETALGILGDPLFETAQVIYNLYDRAPERALFELARTCDLGVIVRVPFDEGALTGALSPDTKFPEGDWRERYFRGGRLAEVAERAAALEKLLGEEARTLPELALRFCLSRPEVSTVIPGMRTPEHVRANAAVSDGRTLSSGLLSRLAPHAWDKNWHGD